MNRSRTSPPVTISGLYRLIGGELRADLAANTAAHRDANAAMDRLTAVLPQVTAPLELSDLEELEALAATAADVYELADTELTAARQELAEAQRRLDAASDERDRAGRELDAARRDVIDARKAAGVVLGADGYRPAVTL
jgi:chromosome segregation ATPase